MKDKIKVIGFDADDTLWVNEPYYREVEESFIQLIEPYDVGKDIAVEVFSTEMSNLSIYGYGIKSFILSLVQCALEITEGRVTSKTIGEILQLGKDMLARPIELLKDVKPLLEQLSGNYKLIVACPRLRRTSAYHYHPRRPKYRLGLVVRLLNQTVYLEY